MRNFWFFAFLGTAAFAIFSHYGKPIRPPHQITADESLESAKKFILLSEDDIALMYLTKAIESNPKLSEAYYLRGKIFEDRGKTNSAFEDYEKVIKGKGCKGFNSMFKDIDKILEEKNRSRLNAMLKFYDKVSMEDGIYTKAATARAEILETRYDIDAARTLFGTVVFMSWKSPIAPFYERGLFRMRAGGHEEEALEDFSRAIDYQFSKAALAHYQQGLVYKGYGKRNKALESFTSAIQKDDSLLEAIQERGNTLVSLGRYEEAMKDFTLLARSKDCSLSRGLLYACKGDHKEAVQELTCAIQRERALAKTLALRAESYVALGQFANARTDCEYALSIDPMNRKALKTLKKISATE